MSYRWLIRCCVIVGGLALYGCRLNRYTVADCGRHYPYDGSISLIDSCIDVSDWTDAIEESAEGGKMRERFIYAVSPEMKKDTCYLFHLWDCATEIRQNVAYDAGGCIKSIMWRWKEMPVGKEYRYAQGEVIVKDWEEGYAFSGICAIDWVKRKFGDDFVALYPGGIVKRRLKGRHLYVVSFYHRTRGLTSVYIDGWTGRIKRKHYNMKIYY